MVRDSEKSLNHQAEVVILEETDTEAQQNDHRALQEFYKTTVCRTSRLPLRGALHHFPLTWLLKNLMWEQLLVEGFS